MMLIDNKFNIGQIVYVVTDVRQDPWIVVAFNVTPSSVLQYFVSKGGESLSCYEFELSEECNELKRITSDD
jgi:hypothetical protein